MIRFILIAFFISAVFAGSQTRIRVLSSPIPRAGKIVGGVVIDIKDAPYQVVFQYFGNLRCGGSLIRANAVATAAHCTAGTSASSISIRAGSTFYNSGGQVVSVDRIFQHESYNPSITDYDYAMLVLSSSITLSETAALINMPTQGMETNDGTMAVTSGWGATSQGGSVSVSLRQVEIPIVGNNDCSIAYIAFGDRITDRMICAGLLKTGGKDACQGDSGGPLVVDGTLVGITSWGYGCARPGYPGVWARVATVMDWYDDKLNRLN